MSEIRWQAVSAPEITPRELGLLVGHAWMEHAATAADAEQVMSGEIPDAVRERLLPPKARERLDASTGDDAYAEYWGGVTAGARAYRLETQLGYRW
jgi:hypothetical protein